MDDVELARVLMNIELFEGLEYDQIEKIMTCGEQRVLAPGDVLSEPLTVDEQLSVFLQGKLRIESADGVSLSEVTEVRVRGEMGVLTGQARSSRIVADNLTTILALSREALEQVGEADPDMGQLMLVNLIKLLYSRTFSVNQEIENLRIERDKLRARLVELAPDDPLLK